MPGAVPHSSTHALVNATLPYVASIAEGGWTDAVRSDPALAEGVNVVHGTIVCEPVAAAHEMAWSPLSDVI
jgi:alanine dehydrogenase